MNDPRLPEDHLSYASSYLAYFFNPVYPRVFKSEELEFLQLL